MHPERDSWFKVCLGLDSSRRGIVLFFSASDDLANDRPNRALHFHVADLNDRLDRRVIRDIPHDFGRVGRKRCLKRFGRIAQDVAHCNVGWWSA